MALEMRNVIGALTEKWRRLGRDMLPDLYDAVVCVLRQRGWTDADIVERFTPLNERRGGIVSLNEVAAAFDMPRDVFLLDLSSAMATRGHAVMPEEKPSREVYQ